jgi:type VI secretion system protein ImpH
LTVNLMGLTGPSGELPLFYSAYVAERVRAGDSTAADFFDLFNHRLISLLYRAWEKYRFTIPYERGEDGGMKQYLMDLIGIGTEGLAGRQTVNDESLVYYSGLLGQQPRSAAALRNILADYFDAPVEVVQFVGAWRPLEESGQCRLEEEDQGWESSRLGGGAVVGDAVWDPQSIVRLRLGPLTLRQYLDFLPTGSAWRPLKAITRFFSGDDLDFEVQLILKRTETPACQLGAEGIEAPRLGWVSWVKTRPMPRDPDETILRLWEDTKSDERQSQSSC